MAIEVTIFADASRRAVEAFRGLPEFAGARWLLPYRTPGIVAPPMGLLAARDRAWLCLAHESPPDVEPTWTRWSIDGPPHSGIPQQMWGPQQQLYPAPSLHAMGVLRELSVRTGARVWVVCDHERGDDPYDQWVWLFEPPRPRHTGYETVFAQGGDAGRVLWQRDLRGPDPWRVLSAAPQRSPISRLIDQLELRGAGSLPTSSLQWYRELLF
ncbi:hypothetical protein [Nannocystis sp. SCPEA4]|uniref:hypothetical protein n=1 Tax=Nannocystis sp. SCPEA4 TaxID=2996787 RepID=UPI00226E05AE|nr:hypothetical protein [Nannocystis sp. SCPEA4]MCY1056635.1 hypothetical protein [Nannocystis sp. SCPEA4]